MSMFQSGERVTKYVVYTSKFTAGLWHVDKMVTECCRLSREGTEFSVTEYVLEFVPAAVGGNQAHWKEVSSRALEL